ncbi:hypothetical protein MGSAQ_001848, partial [marine sediment metagenome]
PSPRPRRLCRGGHPAGSSVVGVDVHIGSQLTDLEPFRAAYLKVAELTRALREDGAL